ncbi:AP endonuclease [Pseudomonas sp. 43A]|uniref:sugar phosphate isomerase/epimerase family protein n=1 Tax=unclassified Pseudomonas TaxID=196821 RepID=UPI001587359D|nr:MULTISPECIES: AP endonuclease [unclassified Pseudomonas]QKV64677.1 AP endonuclease [Pseudomonas sp. 43A]QMW12869.1 AP endonuclease [Pseudomonas sp. 29A]
MNKPAVSISLSSYGAELVRQRGQASFIDVLAAAGANRIEWREELLTREDPAQVAMATQTQGLQSIYSSPTELWLAGQAQPNPELITALQQAEAFGSKWLKVSLGYFTDNNDLQALAERLQHSPVQLLVENDQTLHGGRIEPFQRFFAAVEQHNLPIKMTFDIGNWQWQDQSATSAARLLGRHVGYVHCKAVARRPDGKLVAVPPAVSDLHLWEQLLRHMAQGVMRAAEYPLQGEDLVQLTTEHVAALARLGQSRLEPAHV